MPDDDDLKTMQEEAVRRVREMQRRSQGYLGNGNGNGNGNSLSPPPPPPPQHEHENEHEHRHEHEHEHHRPPNDDRPPARPPTPPHKPLFPLDIGNIELDEEKALIGMLMYVLYKNGADMKLILALGYLLL